MVTIYTYPKVISGGQTGVDQAALRAAWAVGLPTGGTAPHGWRTQAGPAPWLADYGLVESDDVAYPVRTRANVAECDATLWYGNPGSPGGRLTQRLCLAMNRPFTVVKPQSMTPTGRNALTPREVVEMMFGEVDNIRVLNIAGNREESYPGIGAEAEAFLTKLFTLLRRTA